jgi:hypothetical protein
MSFTVDRFKKMLNKFIVFGEDIGNLNAIDPFMRDVNNDPEFNKVKLWKTLNSYKQFEHDEEVKTLLVKLYPYFQTKNLVSQ